jgi:peptidoglycan/xylan/chitin deacetylase (PgdA/CDA1 family)
VSGVTGVFARAFGCALMLAYWGSTPACAEDVALTFDDLPVLSFTDDLSYQQRTTSELLAGLTAHRIPATGFVNESKLEGKDGEARIALLVRWVDAGMDLGNHTYSHISLNTTAVDAYIADTVRGETMTRAILATRGRTPHWFRYPYLETGLTEQVRRTFESWLAAHGYRVAPVTLENSDWQFATAYDDAILRADRATAAHIRQEYLDYTAQMVVWHRKAALALLGRRPALVFLLHATRLNADCIDQLAAILRGNNLHPTTLDKAMRDPAYNIPDVYIGPDGEEWLSRWSIVLHKKLPWHGFHEAPAAIVAAESRLEPDR